MIWALLFFWVQAVAGSSSVAHLSRSRLSKADRTSSAVACEMSTRNGAACSRLSNGGQSSSLRPQCGEGPVPIAKGQVTLMLSRSARSGLPPRHAAGTTPARVAASRCEGITYIASGHKSPLDSGLQQYRHGDPSRAPDVGSAAALGCRRHDAELGPVGSVQASRSEMNATAPRSRGSQKRITR